MNWIWVAFEARIGWFLAEVALAVGAAALVMLLVVAVSLPRWIRQARCSHPTVGETGACDAICTRCGKNLGFIGTWREKQRAALQ